ncbi:MAG: MerC family mercury resistance protein [Alphaproteobacteria bacterium]|nr:MerC family mercury resistance protein [Alphaproteobacteria bacterium]
MKASSPRGYDVAACSLSALCLAHCLVLPLAAAASPFLAAAAEAEWMHWALVAIALPISALALSPAHTPQGARILAGAGLLFLITAAAGFPTPSWETGLSVTGALILTAAHIHNARQTAPHPKGSAACL